MDLRWSPKNRFRWKAFQDAILFAVARFKGKDAMEPLEIGGEFRCAFIGGREWRMKPPSMARNEGTQKPDEQNKHFNIDKIR